MTSKISPKWNKMSFISFIFPFLFHSTQIKYFRTIRKLPYKKACKLKIAWFVNREFSMVWGDYHNRYKKKHHWWSTAIFGSMNRLYSPSYSGVFSCLLLHVFLGMKTNFFWYLITANMRIATHIIHNSITMEQSGIVNLTRKPHQHQNRVHIRSLTRVYGFNCSPSHRTSDWPAWNEFSLIKLDNISPIQIRNISTIFRQKLFVGETF